jgi:hypothetical protein
VVDNSRTRRVNVTRGSRQARVSRAHIAALLLVAAFLAGLTVSLGWAEEGRAAAATCSAGGEGQPSGDQILLSPKIQGPLTQAIADGSQAAADRAAALVGSVQPCSAAGAAFQQDTLAFLGFQLEAKICHQIVENTPTPGGVDAYLTCIAPINAAAVRLERELARLGAQMAGNPCQGQGPSTPGAAAKAVAALNSQIGQARRAAGVMAALAAASSAAVGPDASDLAAGYSLLAGTVGLVGSATTVTKNSAGAIGGSKHGARVPSEHRQLPYSAQLWLATLGKAHTYAAEFRVNVNTLARDLKTAKLGPARAAAGLAQFHADQLAAALASALQAQSHLPTDLKSDQTLAVPLTQEMIDNVRKQIGSGTVSIGGHAVKIDLSLLPYAKAVNLSVFTGRSALSLLNGPELVGTLKRLSGTLTSLGLMAASDRRP